MGPLYAQFLLSFFSLNTCRNGRHMQDTHSWIHSGLGAITEH